MQPLPTPRVLQIPRTAVALATGVVLVLAGGTLAACSQGDGTELRPPRANQDSSISTTAPETVPEFVDSLPPVIDPGDIDDPADTSATGDPDSLGSVFAPWPEGGTIPTTYACDGDNISPSISWPVAPEGTVEIGVAMVDRDAPDFVHWVVAGIDPDATSLAEGSLPIEARAGINGVGVAGYFGPCPPENGDIHRYDIIVFYLDLPVASGLTDGAQILTALTERSVASAQVSGLYSRAAS